MATKFPPPNPPFIGARNHGGSQVPKGLVLHGTVSSDNAGTARNIAEWWHGPTSPVTSAHYVIDPKEVIQTVKDHTVAFHCGFNTGTIALEFCDEQTGPAKRWDDEDSLAILKRGARLAAELCLAYGIRIFRPSVAALKAKGPHGIYGHNDSRLAFGNTTHTDPRDFPWAKFLDMVHAEARAIRAEAAGLKRTFKVLHAPLHVSATQAELKAALHRPGVVTAAFSEAYRQSEFLRSRPRWSATMGGRKRDARGRMVERDVVIMTKKTRGRRNVEHRTVKVANESTPLKIAPERYLSFTVDELDGELLAVVAVHPHAAVRNAWNSDRAAEYRRTMRKLQAVIRYLRIKYGHSIDIVVLGDLNYTDNNDGRHWTPREVFARLDLGYVNHGIDWVAYSKGLKRVKAILIPRGVNGQDHPWIEVEFQRV